ncbi:MAG: SpoIIIAC/SpoIIIAD family protein [Clostridia bacterium]
MNILQIVAFGIVATFMVIYLRPYSKETALLLGIGSGIIIIISVLDGLFDVAYTFYNLAEKTGINSGLFATVIKVIGIGYLTEFAGNMCIDADSRSIGDKIFFAGKICIMIVALPLITSLVEVVIKLLP